MSENERPPEPQRGARWALLACLAVILAFLPFDLSWPAAGAAVAVRLGWVAWLGLTAHLVGRVTVVLARVLSGLTALASGLAGAALVGLTGGMTGPRGGVLMAIPLAALVLLPEEPWAPPLAGLGSVLGGTALWVQAGAGPLWTGEWLALTVAFTALAGVGAAAHRRLCRERLAAEQARAEALDRQRQRLLAEHEEQVALLAAEVAHEINNPLTTVQAGVAFVASELGPGVHLSQELPPAIADTREGVARIRAVVSDLTQATGTGPAAPATALLEAIEAGLRRAEARHGPFEVRRRVEVGEAQVIGDPALLAAAMMHVALAALAHDTRAVEVRAWIEGEAVVVAVAPASPGPGRPAGGGPFRGRELPYLLASTLLRRCRGSLARGDRPGASVVSLERPAGA